MNILLRSGDLSANTELKKLLQGFLSIIQVASLLLLFATFNI